MEGVDIFATKGIEYIFILGFLAILVFFWKALNKEEKSGTALSIKKNTNWFPLFRDLYYHQGHTWVYPQSDGTALVGLDILACKLLGAAKNIEIIDGGGRLRQGLQAARVKINGYSVPFVSPLDGKILEKNETGCASGPRNEKIGGIQWLFKVKPDNLKANLNNLLSGELAQSWREKTENLLNSQLTGNLGPVMQDGGDIEDGFVFSLPEDVRDEMIRKVFLADDVIKEN